MKQIQAATDTFKELAAIYVSLLLVSACSTCSSRGGRFLESFYWAGTTATSTGYGDIIPKTTGGQVLAFVLMHMSIFGVAPLIIVRLVDRLNENRDAFTHEEQQFRSSKASPGSRKRCNGSSSRRQRARPHRYATDRAQGASLPLAPLRLCARPSGGLGSRAARNSTRA